MDIYVLISESLAGPPVPCGVNRISWSMAHGARFANRAPVALEVALVALEVAPVALEVAPAGRDARCRPGRAAGRPGRAARRAAGRSPGPWCKDPYARFRQRFQRVRVLGPRFEGPDGARRWLRPCFAKIIL